MGWSYAARAGWVMDAWTKACLDSTGIQNVFEANGQRYMWEHSRKEHGDGAITGRIWRFLPDERITPNGSFRIEGDGSITRAPAFLKKASPTLAEIEAKYQETFVARPMFQVI